MLSERLQRRVDALLDQADESVNASDWTAVAEKARAVLAIDATNEDAAGFLKMAEANGVAPSSAPAETPILPTPTLPTSFVAGRYAVRRFLGEGGRKRVFLAHDSRLDRDVAVAIIKTEGLDAEGLSRVHREAQAMGRLGDHPNIVTVYDSGDDPSTGSGQAPSSGPGQGSQPYIVSQYMSGGAVDGLALPLTAERTLEIAKDVCRGLAHAHAHGVVHRDLKPGNIWLNADGRAEIGDFGLAVALEQSRLTMHGMLVGTVAYMPPEQALGSETTTKADLYSLGCMLYEMITGRPPFVSDNPSAVISQHINTPPVAPSWHAAACPLDLEQLILRLLEKDPGARPASAAEVLATLDRIDPAGKAASHSDSNVLDRLSLGVFVGREQEMERLRKAFDEAVSGRGGLVLLVGEPGIGKTRTTQELETYAKMRGAQVLWGRTHESAGAPPYWPWLQAGNQYAAGHVDDLTTLIGPLMPPGATAELSRIFPWLRQTPNFVEPEVVSDPEVAQFRLFDAYTSYLKAIASQAPLVVALDDLHWADKPTLQLLQHVARELSRMRVLIVGNYRDTDITRQSALSETLASLNRESGFDRVVLRGLTRDEVGAYIRARANVEPKREVLDRIFEETEGNAFFLSEVVNLMAQEGTLTKDSISDIAIPDGVREALGRRLNRLSAETNELLQVAAIIGRDFAYDTLTLLGDRDEDALLRLVEEAIEARVIEETDQAGRYRFTHAQMQETLLAELSTTRRVRLHGQVGEALERRYGVRADERAARLAFHFSEAATLSPRFSQKAANYSAVAGRQALEQSAYPEAARHFRAALSAREGQEMDDEMARLFFDLGKAQLATLDARGAWTSLNLALDHYAGVGNVESIARVAVRFNSYMFFHRPEQTSVMERALSLIPSGGREEFDLLLELGSTKGMRGDRTGGNASFARAKENLEGRPNKVAELKLLRRLSGVQFFYLEIEEALASLSRVVELDDSLGFDELSGLHFLLGGMLFVGELESAAAHAAMSLAFAEKSGSGFNITSASYLQAGLHMVSGRWDDAQRSLARGLEVAPLESRLLFVKACVELETGDTRAAQITIAHLHEVVVTGHPGLGEAYAIVASAQAVFDDVSTSWTESAKRLAEGFSSGNLNPLFFATAGVGMGLLAARNHDRELANLARAGLAPMAGRFNPSYLYQTDHITGLLSLEFGDLPGAIIDFESALGFMARVGDCPVPYAHAAYDAARAYLERNAPGDRERARTLIDEALGHARDLGMKPLLEKIIALKLQDQGISTTGDIHTSIVAIADAVAHDRPNLAPRAAPDGTVTILFSDIEGSTALNVELGDEGWMELLGEHNRLVREAIRRHNGFEVKTEGDAFMVAFQSARDALRCAIDMQKAMASSEFLVLSSPADGEPSARLRVRIGIHTGEPVRQGDDFYGTHVVLAARIASQASGGDILVSALLRELVAASREFALTARPSPSRACGASTSSTRWRGAKASIGVGSIGVTESVRSS